MSDYFKRMALVPEVMLNTIQQHRQQQITPQTKNLVRMDNQMENILQNQSLSEDDKARQYSQTLQRYLTMYEKNKSPSLLNITQTKEQGSENGNRSGDVAREGSNFGKTTIEEEVLESVPQTFKGRAQSLLKKLKSNPDQLSWNEKGELITEGKVMSGTNVVDLVNDALRPRKNFSPKGYETFIHGLAKIGTAEDLVRNDARRKLLLEYRENPLRQPTPLTETPLQSPLFPTPPSSETPPSKRRRRLPTLTPKIPRQSQWINF